MLFNSYFFIFIFLPVTLLGFHFIGNRGNHRYAISWLVGTSLFFYGWWNPAYLGLILTSILFNYTIGASLGKTQSKLFLTFGLFVNLSLLGYFKYANFFVHNLNFLSQNNIHLDTVILPLAISFFTFQQIAYLVDAYRGLTKEHNFLHYCLFVTFFPQLIAGPIVHHKDMLPQFSKETLYKLKASHLSIGVSIFMLGLFKKVIFADSIASYASPVFEAAENGVILTFFEAWTGSLAFTFQLYFDFSGYSDMAIGIARMFGVILPINFYSPYKANSIIEFWRRWHITLSGFLRDYLYFPLGGNKKGSIRRYLNLMITMLLGGLWHGAGWTFIIWGGMHGIFLSINHGWNNLVNKTPFLNIKATCFTITIARILTFSAVVVSWVMFRADNVNAAFNIYSGMFGFNGIALPISAESVFGKFAELLKTFGFNFNGAFQNNIFSDIKSGIFLLFLMLLIVWFSPNSLDLFRNQKPALYIDNFIEKRRHTLIWKPTILFAFIITFVSVLAIMSLQKESEFLYFQF